MSKKYDDYLTQHIDNVKKAFNYIRLFAPQILTKYNCKMDNIWYHDASKASNEEYYTYDEYFVTGDKNNKKTEEEFNKAWLHHIHENPHHWEHWVIPVENTCIDMPIDDIIEMICDWWSFSFKKGDLNTIFDWYEAHRDKILLSDRTREIVEDILKMIKEELIPNINLKAGE